MYKAERKGKHRKTWLTRIDCRYSYLRRHRISECNRRLLHLATPFFAGFRMPTDKDCRGSARTRLRGYRRVSLRTTRFRGDCLDNKLINDRLVCIDRTRQLSLICHQNLPLNSPSGISFSTTAAEPRRSYRLASIAGRDVNICWLVLTVSTHMTTLSNQFSES